MINKKLCLIDVGAANGFVSDGWKPYENEVQIVMFEPDKRSFELLPHAVKAYNSALGAKHERRELYLTRKPEVSSLLKPNRNYHDLFPDKKRWDILNTILIETVPLDDFLNDIGSPDFIKLDTQGSELDILQGAKRTLMSVVGLEVEVEFLELYQGQPLFGDVSRYLLDEGFEFYDFITEYRYGRKQLDRKGQLAFADALFLRTPEYVINQFNAGGYNSDKVKKYLVSCAAYKKLDLIEVIRDALVSETDIINSCARFL